MLEPFKLLEFAMLRPNPFVNVLLLIEPEVALATSREPLGVETNLLFVTFTLVETVLKVVFSSIKPLNAILLTVELKFVRLVFLIFIKGVVAVAPG